MVLQWSILQCTQAPFKEERACMFMIGWIGPQATVVSSALGLIARWKSVQVWDSRRRTSQLHIGPSYLPDAFSTSAPTAAVTLTSQELVQCSCNLPSSGCCLKSVWWASDGRVDWFVWKWIFNWTPRSGCSILAHESKRWGNIEAALRTIQALWQKHCLVEWSAHDKCSWLRWNNTCSLFPLF